MTFQYIMVALLALLAIVFLVRMLWQKSAGADGDGSCNKGCGCTSARPQRTDASR